MYGPLKWWLFLNLGTSSILFSSCYIRESIRIHWHFWKTTDYTPMTQYLSNPIVELLMYWKIWLSYQLYHHRSSIDHVYEGTMRLLWQLLDAMWIWLMEFGFPFSKQLIYYHCHQMQTSIHLETISSHILLAYDLQVSKQVSSILDHASRLIDP